jgi:hypothetical protein
MNRPGEPTKTDPHASRDEERLAGQPERPDVRDRAATSPVDQGLEKSPLSPNELDQTDESQKAADITRAGNAPRQGSGR